MLDLFRARLEAVDASLWVVDDMQALPGLVRERVGSGSVVAWEEALSYVSAGNGLASASDSLALASPSTAEVSLIVADMGIAETGQVGFAHDDRRPREAALLPNRQIVLLPRQCLVLNANAALQRLRGNRSIVLVAGPSRTADIEQRMMLGVHAPRSLDVIVFG